MCIFHKKTSLSKRSKKWHFHCWGFINTTNKFVSSQIITYPTRYSITWDLGVGTVMRKVMNLSIPFMKLGFSSLQYMFDSNGTQNSSDSTHLPRQQQQASKISLSITKCSIFRSLFNARARSIFSLNRWSYLFDLWKWDCHLFKCLTRVVRYLSWFEFLGCLSSHGPYKLNCTLSLKLVRQIIENI